MKPMTRVRPDAPWILRAWPALPAVGFVLVFLGLVWALSGGDGLVAVGLATMAVSGLSWLHGRAVEAHPTARNWAGCQHMLDVAYRQYRRLNAFGLTSTANDLWDQYALAAAGGHWREAGELERSVNQMLDKIRDSRSSADSIRRYTAVINELERELHRDPELPQ